MGCRLQSQKDRQIKGSKMTFLTLLIALALTSVASANPITNYESGPLDSVVGPDVTIVEFGAEWCPACRLAKKIFKETDNPKAKFVYADVDSDTFPGTELAEYRPYLSGIPFFLALKGKKVVYSGNANKRSLKGFIENTIEEASKVKDFTWKSVLVAGSKKQDVFDNAVEYLHNYLSDNKIKSTPLTANPKKMSKIAAASPDNLFTSLSSLNPQIGDACLVYLTSHGSRGVITGRSKDFTPRKLNYILLGSCNGLPTVVVLSACYSGSFVEPMIGENVLIMTASADDKTSFGCSSGNMFNYYDECFLNNMEEASGWKNLHKKISTCVRRKEIELGVDQDKFSNPQFFQSPSTKMLPYFLKGE